MNTNFTIPTDAAVRDEKIDHPGDYLLVLQAPAAGILVATSPGKDPTRLHAGHAWSSCEPWDALYLTFEAEPGGEVVLWIGLDERLQAGQPPVLLDSDGRQFIRLADRLRFDLDSILVYGRDDIGAFHFLHTDTKGRQIVAPAAVGAHGNAWANAAVGAGGLSAAVELPTQPHVLIFGNTDVATDLEIQVSQDGVNFYAHSTVAHTGGEFSEPFTLAAGHVRLQASAAATITATIAGKS